MRKCQHVHSQETLATYLREETCEQLVWYELYFTCMWYHVMIMLVLTATLTCPQKVIIKTNNNFPFFRWSARRVSHCHRTMHINEFAQPLVFVIFRTPHIFSYKGDWCQVNSSHWSCLSLCWVSCPIICGIISSGFLLLWHCSR